MKEKSKDQLLAGYKGERGYSYIMTHIAFLEPPRLYLGLGKSPLMPIFSNDILEKKYMHPGLGGSV